MKTDRPSNVLAFTWYRRDAYRRLREVVCDPETLPAEYKAWLADARRAFVKYKEMGFEPRRVYLDVDEMLAWCEERGREPDQKSREAYKESRREAFYRGLSTRA